MYLTRTNSFTLHLILLFFFFYSFGVYAKPSISLLPKNTQVFVNITPENSDGNTVNYNEKKITNKNLENEPDCTILNLPLDGDTDVDVTTDFFWNAVGNATGYRINIGDNDNFYGEFDVGNLLTYDLSFDLPENTLIHVRIIPYNDNGDAIGGCTSENFTTGFILDLPNCTALSSPLNLEENVYVFTDLTWDEALNAEGYILSIGTSSGSTDILNNFDLGNQLTYDLSNELPENTEIFVQVIPYNTTGNAIDCLEESFITETIPVIPDCTMLILPANGSINVTISPYLTWATIEDTEGYLVNIGTSSGDTDILDHYDVGNITSYNVPIDFPNGTEIFVTIIPYNDSLEAMDCTEESFTTIALIEVPEPNNLKYGFSPDGNGMNDFWEIDGIENYPNNTVSIYNRWGDLVFKIKNYDNNINVFSGEANLKSKMGAGQLPSGTYFFDIEIAESNNLDKTRGYVVLKR